MRASRPTPVEANQLILRARISRAADGGQGQVTGLEVRSECIADGFVALLSLLTASPTRSASNRDAAAQKKRRNGVATHTPSRASSHSSRLRCAKSIDCRH